MPKVSRGADLIREYRPSMPAEVLHAWAGDATNALITLQRALDVERKVAAMAEKQATESGLALFQAEKKLVNALVAHTEQNEKLRAALTNEDVFRYVDRIATALTILQGGTDDR